MSGKWLVGSGNWATKSSLMKEMLLPKSRKIYWVLCSRLEIVVQTGEVDDVEVWKCGCGPIFE